jgi:hypothetical protein
MSLLFCRRSAGKKDLQSGTVVQGSPLFPGHQIASCVDSIKMDRDVSILLIDGDALRGRKSFGERREAEQLSGAAR